MPHRRFHTLNIRLVVKHPHTADYKGLFNCLTPISSRTDALSETKYIVSVLCTAPNKYTVVDPEGSIRPKFCIDIVVRHSAISPANCNITDKFRIHLQNHTTKQVSHAQFGKSLYLILLIQ
jgi:hypothetical protein